MTGEGEYYDKLFNKAAAMIKAENESKPGAKITLVRMPKQDSMLRYSCLMVAETSGGLTVAHVLIVEMTGEKPQPVVSTFGNRSIEFTMTPGDAMGDKLVTQAQRFVGQALNVPPETVTIADSTLVPNEFQVDSDMDVKRLLSGAVSAIDVEVAVSSKAYLGVNLRDKIGENRNGRFSIKYSFGSNDEAVLEANGLPVNSQVCVSVNYTIPQPRNSRDINGTVNTIEIVRVYGYVEFDVVNGTPRIGQYQNNGLKTFSPNFVITDFVSKSAMLTPDILMLGVAACTSLNEEMNWLQSFRTTVLKKGEIDFADIGGLNLKGNMMGSPTMYGQRPKTKEKDFTMAQLYELVRELVNPFTRISIDVPMVSPSTWYMSVFGFASEASPRGEAAAKRIFNAMNVLTNGAYSSIRNGQAINPFVGLTNRIHGGYYRSKSGIRDLRQITGVLPFSNYLVDTNQAPELVEGFISTLYNSSVSSDVRAAERKRYIDMMSENTAVYKQMFTRYTFRENFLLDVVSALNQVGFAPVQETTFGDNEIFQRRAFLPMDNSVLGAGVRITAMNSGFDYGTYNGSYQRSFQ
jgi:hypothetical protein